MKLSVKKDVVKKDIFGEENKLKHKKEERCTHLKNVEIKETSKNGVFPPFFFDMVLMVKNSTCTVIVAVFSAIAVPAWRPVHCIYAEYIKKSSKKGRYIETGSLIE